jgi:SAM-dependent methyltransferase
VAEQSGLRVPYDECPLCGAPAGVEFMVADCAWHPLYRKPLPETQRWLECPECTHVYVDGYFSPKALEILFSGAVENQKPGHDPLNQRAIWSRMLDSLAALREGMGGRLLDVGFGNGALLTTAAEYGYEVVGLDVRVENVRLMSELGYEAHTADFESFRDPRPFGVLCMADVLEHLPFPKQALRHARSLLAQHGLLFLSMPNADAFVWEALNRESANPYWGELEHYHNFGRKRLFELLAECGFEPLRYGVSARYPACMEVISRRA